MKEKRTDACFDSKSQQPFLKALHSGTQLTMLLYGDSKPKLRQVIGVESLWTRFLTAQADFYLCSSSRVCALFTAQMRREKSEVRAGS